LINVASLLTSKSLFATHKNISILKEILFWGLPPGLEKLIAKRIILLRLPAGLFVPSC
jgi:hypothetical protein